MFIVEYVVDPRLMWFNERYKEDMLFCGFTLFLVLSFGVFDHQTFIYFQF
jgi:hypothetical protein